MALNLHLRIKISMEFFYSSKLQAAQVDVWLQNALQIDPADQTSLPAHYAKDPCAAYLSRVLCLGRLILELWRVPVFDTASLVKILPNLARPGTVRCEIEQPAVEAIPSEAYENAYSLASEMCQWCCSNIYAAGKVSAFQDQIEQVVKKNKPPFGLGGGSTIPVLRVAHQLGLPFFHLGRGIYQIGTGSSARYLDRSHSEGDGFIGVALSANKAISARILRNLGLPAPRHFSALTREAALAAAKAIGFPVVVKPVDANRGEGVTVGIENNLELQAAFDMAKKRTMSGEVLVEQQVPGVCHRLFIARGRLLYAVKRLPLFVEGDGVRTVRQIVGDEIEKDRMRPFWLRNHMAAFDSAALAALAVRGTDCDSTPLQGQRIMLRPIETTRWGGIDEDMTEAVHPVNLKAAVDAAEAFDLEVAGIDIISTDISVPWTENGAVINEVNGGPLLGGGDISRSHVASFLEIYLGGSGCIPIIEADPAGPVEDLFRQQAERLMDGIRSWIVFADGAAGPHGEEIRLDGGTRELGFDPKGQPLRYESSPEEILLHEVLRNRTVDHVVRVKDRAPGGLGKPLEAQAASLQD